MNYLETIKLSSDDIRSFSYDDQKILASEFGITTSNDLPKDIALAILNLNIKTAEMISATECTNIYNNHCKICPDKELLKSCCFKTILSGDNIGKKHVDNVLLYYNSIMSKNWSKQKIQDIWISAAKVSGPEAVPKKFKNERLLFDFIKSVSEALSTRENRLQAQVPLESRSILGFTDNTLNERLINLVSHPVIGYKPLRVSQKEYDKLPFIFPLKLKKNANSSVDIINNLLLEIHEIYKHQSITDKGIKYDGLKEWVNENRHILDNFKIDLGLDIDYINTNIVIPYVKDGDAIVWKGYHYTSNYYINENGEKIIDNRVKATMFLDYCPRSLFPDKVWDLIYTLHEVIICNLGAGSLQHRSFHWGYHFAMENHSDDWQRWCGISKDFPDELRRFMGKKPTNKLKLIYNNNSNNELYTKGYTIIKPPSKSYKDIYNKAWKEFEEYFQWFMFDSKKFASWMSLAKGKNGDMFIPKIKITGNLNTNEQLIMDSIFDVDKEKQRVFGVKNAFNKPNAQETGPSNFSRHVKIAKNSGMGVATSYYGGYNHLLFQCKMAKTFSLLYGEEVVVIPERWRVKTKGEWHDVHIDHAPLPEYMESEIV